MSRSRLVRRPCVGDVIELSMGSATVTAVYKYGRRLEVLDRLGRAWPAVRAENGHWTRTTEQDGDTDA